MRNAERISLTRDLVGLRPSLGTKPVIDRDGHNRVRCSTLISAPAVDEMEKRRAVWSPRYSKDDDRECHQGCEQRIALVVADRSVAACRRHDRLSSLAAASMTAP
jgi:hypothetical protein